MESVALSRRFEKVSRFLAVGAGAVALWAALPPAAGADPVIAAAGDIACDPAGTTNPCRQMETSDLLVGAGLTRVLPVGDITQSGSASLANILALYDPSWGRVKSISSPVLGNHEGTGNGYFDYFNGVGASDGPAGARGKGWYSFDVGSWHIVALNSNCTRPADTTNVVDCGVGSEQERWLRADLAAHPASCTLAYWHHPRYSSGHDGTTRSRSRSGTRSRTPRPTSSCRAIATTTSASHRSIGTARSDRPTGSVSSSWERAARSSPASGRPSRTARCPRTTPSAS